MTGLAGTTIGSFLRQLLPLVALALFMTPAAANAELHLQLHDEWGSTPVPEITRQTVKRPMEFCLKGTGDLSIRRRDVLLSMAYTPPNDIVEPQERLRITQRQDCPAINGISLKLSLQF